MNEFHYQTKQHIHKKEPNPNSISDVKNYNLKPNSMYFYK